MYIDNGNIVFDGDSGWFPWPVFRRAFELLKGLWHDERSVPLWFSSILDSDRNLILHADVHC